jgi:hypothetical protein
MFNYEPERVLSTEGRRVHTVPKAAQISEKYLGVYMGASPLAGKFPKAV